MRLPFRPALVVAVAAAATVAACGRDVTSPDSALAPRAAARLLGPNEGQRFVLDTVIGADHIMVTEYAAGSRLGSDTGTAAGSVTVKTVIPMGAGGTSESAYCITSTIVKVETTAGWRYQIKQPGGCNAEIRVGFENASTNEKAQFSYLYIPGKTKIDQGIIR